MLHVYVNKHLTKKIVMEGEKEIFIKPLAKNRLVFYAIFLMER